ncbi:hypothetical protein [Actinomadura flavalba]|nr:hypothetical protein [Actinomadura flavalba]
MSVELAAINTGRAVVQTAAGRWMATRSGRSAQGKDLIELIKTG